MFGRLGVDCVRALVDRARCREVFRVNCRRLPDGQIARCPALSKTSLSEGDEGEGVGDQ